MPGIPLLNLGYGLGGLVQGYQNQQSQGLQQALQRLALQQAQSQSNAQTLAGLALQAGLLNNPTQVNPLSPINNSATGPQASGAPAVPQAPLATTASPTGYIQPTPGVPVGTTFPPPPQGYPAGGRGDTSLPGASPQDGGPTQPPSSTFNTTRPADTGIDFPEQVPNAPDPNAQQPAPAQQQPDEKTPSTRPPGSRISQNGDDSSSAPSPGGSVAAVFPNGQSIDISSMFKQIDYQKLAQGIAQLAPPGTSQADIYAAVLDLGKLAEGDKVQQQQAGLLARALLGGQFKLAGIGEQQAGAMARTQAQQAGATGRTELQQAGAGQRTAATTASRERIAQEQIAARQEIAQAAQQLRRDAMNIRNANDQARIAQAAQRIAISAQNAGRADTALQIQSLSRQMTAIKPQPDGSYTDQQQQQLKALADRIAGFAALAAQGTTPAGP